MINLTPFRYLRLITIILIRELAKVLDDQTFFNAFEFHKMPVVKPLKKFALFWLPLKVIWVIKPLRMIFH